MKKMPVILAVFLLVSSAAGQSWFKGTFDQALAKSKNEGKMVLIDFFSSG